MALGHDHRTVVGVDEWVAVAIHNMMGAAVGARVEELEDLMGAAAIHDAEVADIAPKAAAAAAAAVDNCHEHTLESPKHRHLQLTPGEHQMVHKVGLPLVLDKVHDLILVGTAFGTADLGTAYALEVVVEVEEDTASLGTAHAVPAVDMDDNGLRVVEYQLGIAGNSHALSAVHAAGTMGP